MLRKIVQIGTANGDDHVRKFMSKFRHEFYAYLIEPNFNSMPLIEHFYSFTNNKEIHTVAVSTYDGEVTMYFNDYYSGNSQVSSVNIMQLAKHGVPTDRVIEMKIRCVTLESLFKRLNITQAEFLFIDTEGHDCDILLNTNFSNIDVNHIIFEQAHSDGPHTRGEKLERTKEYLKSFGYDTRFDCSVFDICTDANYCVTKVKV